MNKPRIIVSIALILIAVALVSISAYAFSFGSASSATTSYQSNAGSSGTYGNYPNGMMGGYMGEMMGSGMWSNWMSGNQGASSTVQSPSSNQNTIYMTVGVVTLIGAVLSGIGGLAYFIMIPKMITTEYRNVERNLAEKVGAKAEITAYASISKTLTAEEKQVLDVLVSHNGKYLQKYIRAETGLSRLKTHRIVARLAERGIVTLSKSGNTNEVQLSKWLQNSNGSEQTGEKSVENIRISI